MKKIGIAIGLLIMSNLIFAAKPTMIYASQPSGTAYSMPISFGLSNLAPVPQDLCSPTISTSAESATCSGLPVCRGAQAKTASFSCSVTTNCSTKVPAHSSGGSCTVSLSVTKPSSLAASTAFSFQLSYGSYNALLISKTFSINGTTPVPPASTYRTITFKNSCSQTIWFGSITGAAPTKNILTGGSIDCTGANPGKLACVTAGGACYSRIGASDACFSQICNSDSDCMLGASCYSSKKGAQGKCFWNNATPSNQSFELTTNATNSIRIPEYESNGIGVVWSGVFGGRTGCTTGGCTSALCTSGTENAQGVCSLGAGFQQPATQSEPTFITFPTGSTPSLAPDAYDVTLINGANVPMSMYPSNTSLIPTSGNPYTCGASGYNQLVGSGVTADSIGASDWQVSTHQSNVAYRYVVPSTATPTRCAIDADCSSNQLCGLSYQSIGSTTAPGSGHLVCGAFAGWFTADQICGTNNSFTSAIDKNGSSVKNFQCNAPIALGTMSNLYQCNGNYAVSCYSNPTTANCCGCVNWASQGTIIPVPSNPSYVGACNNANTTWTGAFSSVNQPQVYDSILFLKESCPSCYVYPFDDMSSSFTCTNGNSSTNNSVDYTIEFCPGGNGNTGFKP